MASAGATPADSDMAAPDMEAVVADKLRAYGFADDAGERDPHEKLARQASTPTSGTRSVYFVDEATGEVSRPGTAGNDGMRGSRIHDNQARFTNPPSSGGATPSPHPSPRAGILHPSSQGSPSPRPSPRAGILRPPSQGRPTAYARPRSSGSGRERVPSADSMVPKPPPTRPASSGSRPPSRDRPFSRDRAPPLVTTPDDAQRDTFLRAAEVPELEPMAGFGADVSVVQEVDEEVQSPGSTAQTGVESALAVGNASLADEDSSILVFNDGKLDGDDGSQPISRQVGSEPSNRGLDEEEGPEEQSPEPAAIAERKLMRVLRFVPWFKEMGMNELRDVARAGLAIFYPSGSTLVRQGDEGDSMFVVVQGRVLLDTELCKGATASAQKNQAQVLGEGQTFGESAIVWVEPEDAGADDDEPCDEDKWWVREGASDGWDYTQREWSATAESDCIVLELPRRRLQALLDERPALVRSFRIQYEQARAATVVQRGFRDYAAGKDAAKKMADMLARAAAAMAEELKSLTPHAQAYMAMMGSMTQSAVGEFVAGGASFVYWRVCACAWLVGAVRDSAVIPTAPMASMPFLLFPAFVAEGSGAFHQRGAGLGECVDSVASPKSADMTPLRELPLTRHAMVQSISSFLFVRRLTRDRSGSGASGRRHATSAAETQGLRLSHGASPPARREPGWPALGEPKTRRDRQ